MYMREYLAYGLHMHTRLRKVCVIGYQHVGKLTLLVVLTDGHFGQQPTGYAVHDFRQLTLSCERYE